MTVSSETSRSSHVGNGLTTNFPTGFVFRSSSQLRVTYTPSGGTPTVWVEGVDYTVVGDDFEVGGATVIATTAPAASSSLVIERDVAFTQLTDFTALGEFSPETHERALDNATYGLQELARRVDDLEAAPSVAGTVEAGDGLEFSPSPTLRVDAHADGSIVVSAAGVQVGAITAAQHDAQTDPTLHAVATASNAGFQHPTDKARQDALWARTITAGAGLTGGGDLSANRTLDVVANADASIVVNANDIQVGVLATDAQHGVRGGGTQHAVAVSGGAAGFLSGADKAKLDGLAADTITSGTKQTADATATQILSFTPDDDTTVIVEAMVTAKNASAAESAGYIVAAVFERHDGVTSQVGATAAVITAIEDDAAWAVAFSIVSPTVYLTVQGAAGKTIDWGARMVRRATG